jgi:hypothetical protein
MLKNARVLQSQGGTLALNKSRGSPYLLAYTPPKIERLSSYWKVGRMKQIVAQVPVTIIFTTKVY